MSPNILSISDVDMHFYIFAKSDFYAVPMVAEFDDFPSV